MYLAEFVRQCLLEVLEGKHDHCDVVESLVRYRSFHYLLYDVSTGLMDGLIAAMEVLLGSDPSLLENFSVADLVEDAVT